MFEIITPHLNQFSTKLLKNALGRELFESGHGGEGWSALGFKV